MILLFRGSAIFTLRVNGFFELCQQWQSLIVHILLQNNLVVPHTYNGLAVELEQLRLSVSSSELRSLSKPGPWTGRCLETLTSCFSETSSAFSRHLWMVRDLMLYAMYCVALRLRMERRHPHHVRHVRCRFAMHASWDAGG